LLKIIVASVLQKNPLNHCAECFDRQTQSSESTAAATVAFNDIESSMYKRRRMQMPLLPTTTPDVSMRVMWKRIMKLATDNRFSQDK